MSSAASGAAVTTAGNRRNPGPPQNFRPGVEFDGTIGTATTEGLPDQPNFDDFLRERGYSPDEYEIVERTVYTVKGMGRDPDLH